VSAFIEDMSAPYRWCDLVLCRAGATSLAELAVVGCPAVLVPFPYAADNHQEHNATALVDAGGARMVLERDLTPDSLAALLATLLGSPATLAEMRDGMRGEGRPQAGEAICAELRELASG
ncbi:MAG: UDP-N-acetylglucosamine--N-acetylmuramyl-(pentapeptide) pyrophosphoryl-undecaprenol N-acetylglucosamine transferase, partial [Nannocystaceae bacterium]